MPASNDPSPEQLERARRHTRVPVDPVALGQPAGRHTRVDHDPDAVSASYATQRYFLDVDGERHLLAPVGAAGDADRALPVSTFLLTAWNPNGHRSTFAKNDRAQRRLRDRLRDRVAGVAVAVPPNHRWFEQVLLTRGIDEDEALEVARSSGQHALVVWAGDLLRVVPTDARSVVKPVTLRVEIRPAPRACPIRDDLDPTGRCVPRGGPWVGASIHAHALWSSHRALGVRLLGCEPCDDGRLPVWDGPGGRSIALADVCMASRYGGASWRP